MIDSDSSDVARINTCVSISQSKATYFTADTLRDVVMMMTFLMEPVIRLRSNTIVVISKKKKKIEARKSRRKGKEIRERATEFVHQGIKREG